VQRKDLITNPTTKAHSFSRKIAVTNFTFTVTTHNVPQIKRHTTSSRMMAMYTLCRRPWLGLRCYVFE